MRTLRLLGVGWLYHMKMISRSPFEGFGQVIWPLFFATVAFLVFRAGDSPRTLLYASLGAAVMGMWSATSTTAGAAMQRERWHGTLELLVATPPHFALILLPVTLAMATIGIYSLGATLLYGHFLFGIALTIVHPLLFVVSVVGTVLVRRARLRVRGHVRPLPGRLGDRQPARVPGLADRRVPRPARALPRLGAADLVGARSDLGHERDSRVRARRLTASRPRALPRARRRLRGARSPRHRAGAPRGPRPSRALAVVTSLRIFFVGGQMSYRALFYWLTPQIYVPSLLVAPIFQILLFAYIGRSAGLQSDKFYLIGNALQYAAVPCLFAMSQLIGGERYQNTLSAILVSPARRIPLFFGRAIPVIANGAFVAAFSLAAGAIILHVHIPAGSMPALGLVVIVAALSCTGLGLINAALSLRIRENAVLTNVLFGFLLIFTGANVPLSKLPAWMSTISEGLPFTHAIAAARKLADGAPFGSVAGTVGVELLVGLCYAVAGYALLWLMEVQSRRYATLERS